MRFKTYNNIKLRYIKIIGEDLYYQKWLLLFLDIEHHDLLEPVTFPHKPEKCRQEWEVYWNSDQHTDI